MKFNKKMSKSGSITLPATLRREYGLAEDERFSIVVDGEDGTIILQRTQGQCLFCKSEDQLITYHGRFVCSSCANNIEALAAEQKFAKAAGQQVNP